MAQKCPDWVILDILCICYNNLKFLTSSLFITYTLPTLMLWISAEQWASHSSSRSSSRVASRLSEKLSTRRSFSTSHLIRLSVRHSSHSLATLLLKLSSSKKKSKPPLFTAKSLFWLSDLLSVCRLSSQSVQGEESTSQLRKGHKFASFFFFLLLLFENFTLKSCTVSQIRLSTYYLVIYVGLITTKYHTILFYYMIWALIDFEIKKLISICKIV